MSKVVTIKIRSSLDGAEGEASFDATWWGNISPLGKVLAIHDARRDITGGAPFEVLSERRSEGPLS